MDINKCVSTYAAFIDNEYTFAGVLQKRIDAIRTNWSDATLEAYLKDYQKHILPYFEGKPISAYNLEDCEQIVQTIKSNFNYSQATENHYRLLIRKVFEQASILGASDNVVWGTDFKKIKPKDLLDEIYDGATKPVKYFTVSQEYEIRELIFTDPKQDGLSMGLLIMFVSGARNTEACAVCFEDVVMKDGAPYICIINSVDEITATSKAGTKTKNGYRYFPISKIVYDFLMERKAWLQEMVNKGIIVFEENSYIQSVDQMPIACKGTNWLTYCTSRQITKAGRELFRKIKITEEQMQAIYKEMENNQSDPLFGKFRDATAYSMRRNAANHMYDNLLNKLQCRYLMGHALVHDTVLRSYFSNDDQLHDLGKKLANRPLVNEIHYDGLELNVAAGEYEANAENVPKIYGTICTEGLKGYTVVIRVVPRDPHERTTITIENEKADCKISGTYRQKKLIGMNQNISSFQSREMNILYDYWRPYAEEEKRRKREGR